MQEAIFIIVFVIFIAASVTISFISMARAPFEYEYQTEIADAPGNEGWVLFGFNGNNTTKEVHLDYVRDEDGNNPDTNALTAEDNVFIGKIDKEIIIGN